MRLTLAEVWMQAHGSTARKRPAGSPSEDAALKKAKCCTLNEIFPYTSFLTVMWLGLPTWTSHGSMSLSSRSLPHAYHANTILQQPTVSLTSDQVLPCWRALWDVTPLQRAMSKAAKSANPVAPSAPRKPPARRTAKTSCAFCIHLLCSIYRPLSSYPGPVCQWDNWSPDATRSACEGEGSNPKINR